MYPTKVKEKLMYWRSKFLIFDTTGLLLFISLLWVLRSYAPFLDLAQYVPDDTRPPFYGSGLAIDSHNHILILEKEYSRSYIIKFDNKGNMLRRIALEPGSANGQFKLVSYTLAVDSQDNIYVSDSGNSRVQKLDADGHFLSSWNIQSYDKIYPNVIGVAVDNQANVYVIDNGSHIQKFDPNGQLLKIWGGLGRDVGRLVHPYNLAVDKQGSVYVLDNKNIQKFDGEGNFLLRWSSGDPNAILGSIAIDNQNNVYMAQDGRFIVQKFDEVGHLLQSRPSTPGKYPVLSANIIVDAAGNTYSTSEQATTIEKYDSSGRMLTSWDYRLPAWFWPFVIINSLLLALYFIFRLVIIVRALFRR